MRRVLPLVAALALGGGLLPTQATPAGVEAAELFTTPLPIPDELTGDEITLTAAVSEVEVLPGAPTTMWTFNGTFPGPTIRRPVGALTTVTVVNDLPDEVGSITVHNHGNHSASEHDGQPHGAAFVIEPGAERAYEYTSPRGAMQWYHDHSHYRTGRNVWMGLAGMYIVDDPAEEALGLPTGEFDVPLMITERRFDSDNQLVDTFTAPHREHGGALQGHGEEHWPPTDEVAGIGNRILVNGAPEPYFDVRARTYRLRILNANNFSPVNVALSNGQPLVQVGTESGLLPRPETRSSILLGPAERADVVVDFSGAAGEDVLLRSVPASGNTSALGSGFLSRTEPAVGDIMKFRVGEALEDPTAVPGELRDLPAWTGEASQRPDRTFVFGFSPDDQGRPSWTINGRAFDHDRVEARPEAGSVETWMFVNASPRSMSHYIHLHHTDWYLVSRNGVSSPPGEAGLKETFRLDPGEVVVVAAQFGEHLGRFMMHCHMLEHEDHGMMATFEVVAPGEGDLPDSSGLPDLPGLPDLSDLPDLPGPPGLPDGPDDLPWPVGARIVVEPNGPSFAPATSYHAQGQTAEVTNLDVNLHDIRSDEQTAPGVPLFRSDLVRARQTEPIVGTDRLEPGTYRYHCSLHPGMVGAIIVTG